MYNNYLTGQPAYTGQYGQYMQPAQSAMLPKQEVVKVNGENGARAFQMAANSSALLLDESGLLVWLVVTDGAGYKSVMPYDITPHKTAAETDFSSLESRIARLEGIINGNTSNTSTTEQSTDKPANQQDKKYDGYAQKRK